MKHVLISLLSLLMVSEAYAQLTVDSCKARARKNYPCLKQFDLEEQSHRVSVENA